MNTSFTNEKTGVLARPSHSYSWYSIREIEFNLKSHSAQPAVDCNRQHTMNPTGALDLADGGDAVDADHQAHEGQSHLLPYAFEKELIENSNRQIRLNRTFVPVSQVYPLTRKFYAQYEQRKLSDPLRYIHYTPTEIQTRRHHNLISSTPLLESQMYGWVPLLAQDRSIQVNFLHAPKLRCCMTIHGEHLIAERMTERAPFNGLRFLLH